MGEEMIGKKFGRLTVRKRVDDYIAPSGGTHKNYECICECGAVVNILKEHLTSGRQKSCGCLRKDNGIQKHGEIKTRLYRIWGNMCNRCTNPNNPAWKNYGGRGISVCDEWKEYINFRDWAFANGYTPNLTIDRINNNGNYCPSNCRWADTYTQANNKRNNRVIEYHGQTKTLNEWSKYLGIPYKDLHNRIRLGWDIKRAFEQPLRKSPIKSNAPNTKVS